MRGKCLNELAVVALVASTAAAEAAKAITAAAATAMGMDNLNAIAIYGSVANGNLGQSNNANDQLLFFFQAEDGIRDLTVTGVQTCALPISRTVKASGINRDAAKTGCAYEWDA